jgi:hypothetical protein
MYIQAQRHARGGGAVSKRAARIATCGVFGGASDTSVIGVLCCIESSWDDVVPRVFPVLEPAQAFTLSKSPSVLRAAPLVAAKIRPVQGVLGIGTSELHLHHKKI